MPRAIFLGDYEASAQGRTCILACQALRSVEWPSQSCWIDRIINAFCPKQSHWYFLKTIRMGGKCDPYGFESLTLKIIKIENFFFFLEKFHSRGAFSGSLINCLEFCCSPSKHTRTSPHMLHMYAAYVRASVGNIAHYTPSIPKTGWVSGHWENFWTLGWSTKLTWFSYSG